MDHGEMEHEVLIYRETLQVPMLFKLPGNERAGDTVTAPAQLIDVLPTILDVVGITPPRDCRARACSDSRTLTKNGSSSARASIRRSTSVGPDLASMIEDRYHFIDGPDPELYDLIADPGETENSSSASAPSPAGYAAPSKRSTVLCCRRPRSTPTSKPTC